MKILILEDDLSIADHLEQRIAQFSQGRFEVVAKTHYSADAMLYITEKPPDLALLDIQLQDDKEAGIKVGTFIRKVSDSIGIVYLTGLTDKESYDKALPTDFLDFLSKPYDEDSLAKVLDLAYFRFERGFKKLIMNPRNYRATIKAGGEDDLWLQLDHKKTKRVVINDMIYIKTDGKYLQILSASEKDYIVAKITLKSLYEEYLQYRHNFIQIHRQHLINSDFIDEINWIDSKVKMDGGTILPIGGNNKETFKAYIESKKR